MADPSLSHLGDLWLAALERLEASSTDGLYQAISAMAQLKAIEGDKIVIALPYEYLRDVFGSGERSRLATVFAELLDRPAEIEFIVEATTDSAFSDYARKKRDTISQRKQQLLDAAALPQTNGAPPAAMPLSLNSGWTFASLVEDEANRLAVAAAKTVAAEPGRKFNPLFLYGATGLGKTHLLHAIANDWQTRNPGAQIQVMGAEDFVNEHLEAIRLRDVQRVRDRHLAQPLLLLDDLHFLINKPNCQDAFTYLLKAFLDSGRQIVLTADRRPRDLNTFGEHLVSRLEGGLIAELERPGLDMRLKVLRHKAQGWGLDAPRETLELIATRLPGNMRSLEGCLRMLQAQTTLRPGPLPPEEVDKLVQGFLSTSPNRRPVHHDINSLMETICQHYRVSPSDMLGRGRTNAVVHPRHIVMYFARELTNMSLAEIGRAMGNRDHSTVSYAIERLQGRATMEKTLQRELDFIRRLLLGDEANESK